MGNIYCKILVRQVFYPINEPSGDLYSRELFFILMLHILNHIQIIATMKTLGSR